MGWVGSVVGADNAVVRHLVCKWARVENEWVVV